MREDELLADSHCAQWGQGREVCVSPGGYSETDALVIKGTNGLTGRIPPETVCRVLICWWFLSLLWNSPSATLDKLPSKDNVKGNFQPGRNAHRWRAMTKLLGWIEQRVSEIMQIPEGTLQLWSHLTVGFWQQWTGCLDCGTLFSAALLTLHLIVQVQEECKMQPFPLEKGSLPISRRLKMVCSNTQWRMLWRSVTSRRGSLWAREWK